jgi:spore coat protein U-like protein
MKRAAAGCLLFAYAGAIAPARAATTCTLDTSGGVFGSYDPTTNTTLTIIGSGSVTCTYIGTGFDASITLATGSSGSYAARTLVLGNQKLKYNIYLDPAHTEVFGNGTNGTYAITVCFAGGTFSCPSGGSTSGTKLSTPVYAMLPGGQDVAAGSYTDTLVATVTY